MPAGPGSRGPATAHRAVETLRRGKWMWRNRSTWNHLTIHRAGLTNRLPTYLTLPLLCGHVKGRLRCPSDVTIVLIHNREYAPIMERSLRYVGIRNYVVLRPTLDRTWHQTVKLVALLDYLDRGACTTEYLFYCDADDVVLRDDPAKAVTLLNESGCDWLLSFDEFAAHYECMPEIKAWADELAASHGHPGRYLNTGVWIGRAAFVQQVLRAASAYITTEDLSSDHRRRLSREGRLCRDLPDFPKGVGSDQILLRHLQPRFHPRIGIEYSGALSLPRWAPSTPHGG